MSTQFGLIILYKLKLSPHHTNNAIYLSFTISDKAPSEATFRGTEFLSYDLGQTGGEPIVSAQDAISLYFRTRQPNGLLFFTGKLNCLVRKFTVNRRTTICTMTFFSCQTYIYLYISSKNIFEHTLKTRKIKPKNYQLIY